MSAEQRLHHSLMRSQERSRLGQHDTPEALLVGVLQIAQVLEDLITAIDELAARFPEAEPVDCRNRTCSYFKHYLAQGPKVLEHEGYHSAEERCTAAHDAIEEHYKVHPECGALGSTCHGYQALEKQANRWEELVRA